jgi:hypothetical protein
MAWTELSSSKAWTDKGNANEVIRSDKFAISATVTSSLRVYENNLGNLSQRSSDP